ncbi:hypothetical protein [Gracilibacillus xinjiangensis]|uniref:Flagellar protein FliT n=1 Tax=Gracilibacillus xinjiangensis TaxID=1193282 RepID=A0ABV8X0T7_9BACI
MNPLKGYLDISKKLLLLIDKPINKEERDLVIANISDLIEQRQQYIRHIQPPYNEEEICLGKECIVIDQLLEPKMHSLLNEIKLNMQNTKKQSKSNKQYLNPYKSLSGHDGMFLDSKK